MGKRKICIVTGTRAEYGLLYWLMKEIQNDGELELQIIATGMHLSPEFGLTFKTIEADGFTINEKVEMLMSSDTPVGITKSIGLGVIGFADALDRLKPDILIVLGDRYEIFAAAQAALIARIPIAHIHGGESTEGLIDEAIRHSVTKMSHLHFVANEMFREVVIQLGEDSKRVFNFGALGIDNIIKLNLFDREQFEQAIEFKLGELSMLVTYHPVTLKNEGTKQDFKSLLMALDNFPEAKIIFTKPNSDTDGRIIAEMIDKYALKYPDRIYVSSSLGQLKYLSAIKHVDVVIGNSSSGIIEVPYFKKPTVNIGNRQKGRIMAESIINSSEDKNEIINSINKALSNEFQKKLPYIESPYGQGGASLRIKKILKEVNLDGIIIKRFYKVENK